MTAGLQDEEHTAFDPIDQTVLAIDTTRPPTCQVSPQRLGLADTGKRRSLDGPHQTFDPLQPSGVGLDPECAIGHGPRGPSDLGHVREPGIFPP